MARPGLGTGAVRGRTVRRAGRRRLGVVCIIQKSSARYSQEVIHAREKVVKVGGGIFKVASKRPIDDEDPASESTNSDIAPIDVGPDPAYMLGWEAERKLDPYDVTFRSNGNGGVTFVGRIMADNFQEARSTFGKIVGLDPEDKRGSLWAGIAWPVSEYDRIVGELGGCTRRPRTGPTAGPPSTPAWPRPARISSGSSPSRPSRRPSSGRRSRRSTPHSPASRKKSPRGCSTSISPSPRPSRGSSAGSRRQGTRRTPRSGRRAGRVQFVRLRRLRRLPRPVGEQRAGRGRRGDA